MSQRSPMNPRNQNDGATGFSKRSAARAKPARDAAATVRVQRSSGAGHSGSASGSRGTADMTKEQRKEARRVARDEEDRQATVVNILLKKDDTYRARRRVWWILIIAGLVLTGLSWLLMFVLPGASADLTTSMGIASVVVLVGAYIGIIGAFIFDFVRIRPLRDATEAQVRGMTNKRRQAVLDEDYAALEADQAEREASKHARGRRGKGGKGSTDGSEGDSE